MLSNLLLRGCRVPRQKTCFEVLRDSRAMTLVLNTLLLLVLGMTLYEFLDVMDCDPEAIDFKGCKLQRRSQDD
ncbi:hypothetical protein RRG08_001792 [Elysia crispata]|uniref:Uncharacterized protein n=1 Tax=Elysia crispata TaxID=231223 RepID=A0AAE1B929_9GAST|nr:hypothetical protein RRG08_001792 [Elysia crispata]